MAKHQKLHFLLATTFTLFLIIAPTSSSSSEKQTLLTFKSTIKDPKYTLSNWSNVSSSSSLHHCNWAGITCNPSLSITSINLQSLNLSGQISSSICKLTNLSDLNLSDNFFNQPFPVDLYECLKLERLNFSGNFIYGEIPENVSLFGSLKVFDFSNNHLEGKIENNLGLLKNLEVLNLSGNLLYGDVSSLFGDLIELVVLDLSRNPFLASELPSDVDKLVKLEKLLLQSCDFHGVIPQSFLGLKSLTVLDLSQNNLTGTLPQTQGSSLKNLVIFDVSVNKLYGSLFHNGVCFGNEGLVSFSVHANLFNGSISNGTDECANLEKFQVQNNDFSGDFPSGLWSLPRIKLIRAENNRFMGAIPDSVSMATQLEQVQIDNNSFISEVPRGLGLVKSLYRFSASLNGLYGEIPTNFCDSPVMSIVNLSHNSLSGHIPDLLKCKRLVSLSLADNHIVGIIPSSFGDLPVLTYLDLSSNNLTGSIPQELQNLKLALFNVSFNHLSGQVPFALIAGLPASFLQGNQGLCGPGLPSSCSEEHKMRHQTVGLTTLSCAIISIAFLVGISVLSIGIVIIRQNSTRKSRIGIWRSVFFYPLRITEHDLVMGLDEKSLLGTGGVFGKAYVISLPSGELVAVKKLPNFGALSSKTLRAEIKTLAKIRHKNIAKILGFCYSDEEIFLIYEFIQKGSLGDLISRQGFALPWNVRLRIAIGVGQGLGYIHKDYVPHLLHRNIKSKNILLDADFEPRLTDYALNRVFGEAAFQSLVDSESALSCYIAPEKGYCKKATEQMDIYSYGVVLLELVTGKPAEKIEKAESSLSSSEEDSVDIVKWVRRKINITEGNLQVLDHTISNSSSVHQIQMLGVLEIALRCTAIMPNKRPCSMFEVVRELQSLCSPTA